MNKKGKTQRGITLIALVITIIVMLILVVVTISMAVNGGLFDYAGKAVRETNNALKAEGQLANGGIEVDGQWYNSIDEYLETKNGGEKVETISKTESYIGYYADVDSDGTVDGVIYADLVFTINDRDDENGNEYSYGGVAKDELKDYYISGTNYEDDFGTKDVLTSTGKGKDRFYVLALSDFTQEGDYYCWYDAATMNGINEEIVTSCEFGAGKANTVAMIEKWNTSAFGVQNGNATYKDVWGPIQTLASKGWFVPSAGEWRAIYSAFIPAGWSSEESPIPCGLSSPYITSSQTDAGEDGTFTAYAFWFDDAVGHGAYYDCGCDGSVRLSTTF